MTLKQLQDLFWRSVRVDPAPREVDDAFLSVGALDAQARMRIYRDAYWYRQIDALFETFPTLVKRMGDEAFTKTMSAYLAEHPSQHPALEHVGTQLAAFLRARDERVLGAVAELERAKLLVFLAPDEPKVDAAQHEPSTFGDRVLGVADNVLLVEEVPAVLREAEPAVQVSDDTVALAVWREGFQVYQRPVEPFEREALAAARQQPTVAEWCGALVTGDDVQAEAQRVFSLLSAWFARGWVRSFELRGA